MHNNFSIVISAPSGGGKTTIIKRLLHLRDDLEFSISTTTRQKRDGEIDGESYHFITKDEFDEKILFDEFLEYAMVHGNYYGTLKKEIDRIKTNGKISIFDVDIQGGKILKRKIPEAVFIFIIPPSIKELEKRLKGRKTESEESIKLRLKNAVQELKEYYIYDYIVINDDIDTAVSNLQSIITSQLCKKDKVQNYIDKILGAL